MTAAHPAALVGLVLLRPGCTRAGAVRRVGGPLLLEMFV
jgi:hypothetical protein